MIEDTRISPRTRAGLIGHDDAEARLLDLWSKKKMPHALLITGPKGIGKASFAYRIARFVLATKIREDEGPGLFDALPQETVGPPTSMDIDPECGTFRRVAHGSHPDFMLLEKGMVNPKTGKETPNEINVGVARQAVDFTYKTPAESDWKVLLVDAADDLNRSSANALLKALEEPPGKALYILISHAPGKLLPTIRSRCRKIALHPLPDEAVRSMVQQEFPEVGPEDIEILVNLAEGSPGRALEYAGSGGIDIYRMIREILNGNRGIDPLQVHVLAETVSKKDAGSAFETFRSLMDLWLQRITKASARGAASQPSGSPQSYHSQSGGHVDMDAPLIEAIAARGSLEQWIEVWEKTAELLAKAGAPANLDKKQLVIAAFGAMRSAVGT